MRSRQPVHVVYGGAHLFKPDIAPRLGRNAIAAAAQFGPIGEALRVSAGVERRVLAKLEREPVEDYRIDFEDGYGFRTDGEEDRHAESAAHALREGMRSGSLPPYTGLRIKPLNAELGRRSRRTLDLFFRALGSPLPPNFAVTLPKIETADEVSELAARLTELEVELGHPAGATAIEIMIETPRAFMAPSGACNLPMLREAGKGRVRGAHFGPFDYTSSIGIASNAQSLRHPACDLARHAMQVAFAPTGVWLADGPTNVMPVARERGVEGVREAWRLHFDNVRHAMYMGFYQGWDLHPAQLVSRYAAVYSFFEEALPETTARLRNFVDRAAQATMVGQTFDDAATGQGLLNFFLQAINCGAVSEDEVRDSTGLTHAEILEGSFAAIVSGRAR